MSKIVDRLMARIFDSGRAREPRSDEYKDGVRALLENKINGTMIRCRYKAGTAQADAYFDGVEEGHAVYRKIEDHLDRLAAAEAIDEDGENVAFDDVISDAGL